MCPFLLVQRNKNIKSCKSRKSINISLWARGKQNSVPEGLVDGPVPADEGHRGEEDEPEDGQTEVNPVLSVCSEVSQAGQHVEEESGTVDCGDTQETNVKHTSLLWKS